MLRSSLLTYISVPSSSSLQNYISVPSSSSLQPYISVPSSSSLLPYISVPSSSRLLHYISVPSSSSLLLNIADLKWLLLKLVLLRQHVFSVSFMLLLLKNLWSILFLKTRRMYGNNFYIIFENFFLEWLNGTLIKTTYF